eukprot:18500_1
MTFELLEDSRLYPLYSDMEQSDTETRLCLPSTIHRRRHAKSPTPPRTRNIPHYDTPDFNTLSPFAVPTSISRRSRRYHHLTPKNTPKARPKTKRDATKKRMRKKRRAKRRIRTFYSKKWGNKLYGLTGNYPIVGHPTQSQRDTDRDRDKETESTWQPPHTLDLNELRALTSPSASPMMNDNRLQVAFRFNENMNYDSSVSNTAANTDMDDDEANHRFCTLMTPNAPNTPNSPNTMNMMQSSNLKIIVSAPDRQEQDTFNLRMNMKRNMPIYMSSDDESGTDQFSSSEDDDETTNGDELMHRSSLFLSGNNMNVGVYSDFGLSDQSDTDYMSAQSGDFDEFTICYEKRKNERNIRFRDRNYLSDNIGPSDIGSSDTDYFSSGDSIPDSVPDIYPDSVGNARTPQIGFRLRE